MNSPRGFPRILRGILWWTLVGRLFTHVSTAQSNPSFKWPFSAPFDTPPPSVHSVARIRNPIDQFILAKLESNHLQLAPEAENQVLIRRLYLTVLGVPPTPPEVDAFLKDSRTNAWATLVDHVLEDPRYGETWARHWLDLARYADTAGYEGDPDLPHAWRYRNYVIDAFNQDKPYDRFILEQIAGDEMEEIMGAGDLPEPKPEATVAMTFLRLAPFTEPRGDASRHELLSEMTSTVASVFLGLTIGCAQCHDHKYDSIPTADFYRLKAFFATVQMPRPLPGDGFQLGGPLPAEFYRPGEKQWAEQLTSKREAGLASERALITQLEAEAAAGNKATPKVERTPQQKQELVEAKSRSRFIQQDLLRLKPQAMSIRHSYGPPFEPGVPETHILRRGEWDKPGAVVEAGFPSCITGNQQPAEIRLDPFKRWPTRSRRATLAQWIASKENPMTARVMVNRLWAWHFGRGLVVTPSDFGKLSGGASHPELLDWLANRFVESKWSIKTVHRLVLNSATWRQSSTAPPHGDNSFDPSNTYLWHFPSRRLEAEALRDCVLSVSGRLNPEHYGLPIFPPLPDEVAEAVKWNESKWAAQEGPEGRRRSIYIYQQRSLSMPFLQVFDAVVCDASRDRRPHSTTPLQALAMYNGSFASGEARHFAERLRSDAGPALDDQMDLGFRLALGRRPNPDELSHFRQFIGSSDPQEALAGFCRVLLNSAEFSQIE